jgi:hypothetical protein
MGRHTLERGPGGITPDDVIRHFLTVVLGPVKRLWARCSRRTRRCVKVLTTALVLIIVFAGPAFADDGVEVPTALSWINYEDSYGLKIWQYELSLDRGGATSPGKVIWSFFIDIAWQMYRGGIGISCWLVDWTLSFDWLQWLTKPALELGDALQKVVDRFGAGPTFLSITAVAGILLMMRGRWVTGFFEILLALVIAALSVGFLSNPIDTVAGDNGVLVGSRDFGLTAAAGLKNNGDTSADPDETREDVVSMIVETFLRRPAQLINFGAVLDGTECEDAYQDKAAEGPFGDDDDLRNAVKDCNEGYGKVAENPNGSMFMSMVALYPTAFVVLLFAIILCGAVIMAGAQAVFQAVKLIIALVLALLPSGARGSLWYTLASVFIALVEVVFATVFLTAYLLVIQNLLSGDNPVKAFFIIDVMMLVGIILFWRGRARLKAATARIAAAMSRRPGGAGGPSSLPKPASWRPSISDAYFAGRTALGAAKLLSGGGASATTLGRGRRGLSRPEASPQPAALTAGPNHGPGAGPAGALVPAGDPSKPGPGSADRVLAEVKGNRQAAALVGHLALAGMTGGTSLAPVALNAAKQNATEVYRRKALEKKLRAATAPNTRASSTTSTAGAGRAPAPRPQLSTPTLSPSVATAVNRGSGTSRGAGQPSSAAADRLHARLAAAAASRRA